MKHSDYNFCNKIVQIPLTYGEERPKSRKYHRPQRRDGNPRMKKIYFLRRSNSRPPFLHKRNVRRYNPRKNYDIYIYIYIYIYICGKRINNHMEISPQKKITRK